MSGLYDEAGAEQVMFYLHTYNSVNTALIGTGASTSAEDLGKKHHLSLLQSQHLSTRHEQKATDRGPLGTTRPAGVRAYLILQTLYQKTHNFLFLALRENGGYSGNPRISLEESRFP